MRKSRLQQALWGATLSLSVAFMPMQAAYPCTRAVYLGPEDTIITTRSMDWKTDLGSNLWAFPRGMQRDGAAGPTAIRWTSKYGSVVATAFDAVTADGMNEKGLVANLLYLAEADYVKPAPGDKRLPLSVAAWTQYALDHYATVAEAVAALRAEPFYVVPVVSPDGAAGTVHLSISDAAGDSAIFEYVDGKLVIHHGRQYQVMTNSPVYDQQLALDAYWKQIGGGHHAAGYQPRARPVRAGILLHQCHPEDGQHRRGCGQCVLSDSQCVGPAGYFDAGSAEHLIDPLAYGVGPQEQALLFRIDAQPERLLGQRDGYELRPGGCDQEAHADRR